MSADYRNSLYESQPRYMMMAALQRNRMSIAMLKPLKGIDKARSKMDSSATIPAAAIDPMMSRFAMVADIEFS